MCLCQGENAKREREAIRRQTTTDTLFRLDGLFCRHRMNSLPIFMLWMLHSGLLHLIELRDDVHFIFFFQGQRIVTVEGLSDCNRTG